MPIKASGQSRVSMGAPERPTLSIGVVATTLSSDLASANIYNFGDLVGKKVTIRSTLAKYLKGGSADTSAGNSPVEFPKATYLIESITNLQGSSISYELTTPFDTQGMTIPHRRATANLCSWVYKGVNLSNIGAEYSACYWPEAGNWDIDGTSYRVYFNVEDEPIVDSSITLTTYSSGSVTENSLYKTTTTETRLESSGATSSVSTTNFWQATAGTSSPGTPSDTNSNFRRVRVYEAYNASTTYYSFEDSQHNHYVRDSSGKVWQVTNTITGETPGFNAFWALGDVCGKKLNSCAIRYGIKPIGSGATTRPSSTTDTTVTLPFGGFPGLAKKLLR